MCDVVEVSSETLKETIVRMLEFFFVFFLSQETSVRSSRLKLKFPFDVNVTLFMSS